MLDSNSPSQGLLDLCDAARASRGGRDFRGMRLSRVELRNFGTYDGPATVFEFGCEGSILSGENGSGKSTAFDAIKVAFVVNPDLNSAAGSKSERSVTSYYRGAYGDAETDEGLAEEKCLRPLGDMAKTMGILVKFENAKGDILCAVKLLYIDTAGKRNWRYILAHRDLGLDRDFLHFETVRALRDRGDARGFQPYETHSTFMAEIARGLGMDDEAQAVRAFTLQAMAAGLPTLDSTAEFARRFIFPADDLLQSADKAVDAIEQHGKVRMRIAETEAQLAELRIIVGLFDRIERAYEEQAELKRDLLHVDVVRHYAGLMQERAWAHLAQKQVATATAALARREAESTARKDELASVAAAISEANGDAIDSLERDLSLAQTQREARQAQRQEVLDLARSAGIGDVPETSDGWARIQRNAGRLAQQYATQLEDIEAQHKQAIIAEHEANSLVQRIGGDLRETRASQSALSKSLRDARGRLAAHLGLSTEDLPFTAELVQVRDDALDWEGVANRVLGSRARTILVPERHYSRAKGHLPKLHAPGDRIRLERVSDREIDRDAAQRAEQDQRGLDPDALAGKLEVKDDHRFAPWIFAWLAREASHLCVDDDRFGAVSGRAVTRSGAVSLSDKAAEKDDRRAISDRSTYVLGWSVERRVAALEAQLKDAGGALRDATERLKQCGSGRSTVEAKLTSLGQLSKLVAGKAAWALVDTAELKARIDALSARIAAIETDGMKKLRARRRELDALIEEDGSAIRRLDVERASAQTVLNGRVKAIAELKAEIDSARHRSGGSIPRDGYERMRARLASIRKMPLARPQGTSSNLYARLFPVGQGNSSTIRMAFDDLRSGLDRSGETRRKQASEIRNNATRAIDAYLDRYDGERMRLSRNAIEDERAAQANRNDWRARLRDVEEQDLPQAREAAERFRKTTLHAEVSTLKSLLIEYDDRVSQIARGINKIMAGNIYNPSAGTYARLKVRRSQNDFITEFEGLLNAALDSHTSQTEEESFENVSAIARFLKDDGTTDQDKRRREVSRLANRFEAALREVRHAPDGTEQLVRNITGSGKLSGGEKERLSVFLLGAAMSCAFNGHDDSRADRALHTILIDEAFSKSTDENAGAAIRILDSFGLQIIAATPNAKIRPFQPVVGSMFQIARSNNLQSVIQRFEVNEIDFGAPVLEELEVPAFEDASETWDSDGEGLSA